MPVVSAKFSESRHQKEGRGWVKNGVGAAEIRFKSRTIGGGMYHEGGGRNGWGKAVGNGVGGRGDGARTGRAIAAGAGGDVEADLARGMVESAIRMVDGVYDEMRDVGKREGISAWVDADGKTQVGV